MKKNQLFIALFLTVCFSCLSLQAQEQEQEQFTGTVTYSITFPGMASNPMLEAVLPYSQIIVIGDNMCKTTQLSSSSTSIVFVDGEEGLLYIFISAMGQKYMAKEKIDKLTGDLSGNGDINTPNKTYENDIKEIAGYKCHKMDFLSKDSTEVIASGYYNEELYNSIDALTGQDGIKALPLEVSTDIPQLNAKMLMTATKVKKGKVKKSEFALPEGYTEVSMDALQNMGGGL